MKNVRDCPAVEFKVTAYDTVPRELGTVYPTTFRAFCTDVLDEDENVIGQIGGGIGHLVVSFVGGSHFMIRHDDLWNALKEHSVEVDYEDW